MAFYWVVRHWFLFGLLVAAALAFSFPEVGAVGGPLRPEITTKMGVAIIFLLQGLVISPSALRAGALRWDLHASIQLFVFLGFPIALILLDAVVGHLLREDLRLGFLFLAIVPTTVSTCVIFTAAARGNTVAALFNSALANITGVVITPLWAALLLSARGEAPSLLPMMAEVILLLLIPLLVGQVIRPLMRRRGESNLRWLSPLSNIIILFIVFAAFANSVQSGAFMRMGLLSTIGIALGTVGIFSLATGVAALLGRGLGFNLEDRVALLFCGSQKTLAAGLPMGQIIFAGHAAIGIVLLPLMVYHTVQLLVGAFIAQRVGQRNTPPMHLGSVTELARSK